MQKTEAINTHADIMENVLGYERVVGAQSVSESGAPIFVPKFAMDSNNKSDGNFDTDPRIYIGTGITYSPETEYGVVIYCQREEDLESPLVLAAMQKAGKKADRQFIGLINLDTTPPSVIQQSATLAMGDSIGHVKVSAGTLGLFVRDIDTDEQLILSNNHILANNNNANIGDTIIAPGRVHGGKQPRDKCGTLYKFIKIDMNNHAINEVDAALSTILASRGVTGNIVSGIPGLPNATLVKNRTATIKPNENAHKLGRTTKGTSGIVQATNVHVPVGIRVNGQIIRVPFSDQISISSKTTSFSKGGDSGSAILNDQAEVVALLFSGSTTGGAYGTGTTFASPIDKVFKALNIKL